MQPKQLPLFPTDTHRFNYPFPSTRYRGSKRKLVDWIWANTGHLEFNTVLDIFGGTGAVSHLYKNAGKAVTYNDALAFNYEIGLALIENPNQILSDAEIDDLLFFPDTVDYPNVIHKHFHDIYFTDEENCWLDRLIYNIEHLLTNRYQKALARFALFQACIIKRPYNLFHRANLYMRTADVERSFGNKTTWDTPFELHFRNFIIEANQAVFDNMQQNQAICFDALQAPTNFDLVYIDPPYVKKKNDSVDYGELYHFLEGIVSYETWPERIDLKSRHRRLQIAESPWNDAAKIADLFDALIQRYRDSILVISYRDDGIPSKQQLLQIIRSHKPHVQEASHAQKYALAHKDSHELLLIAE